MSGPRIVFIDGLPGSGKSTAAVAIGRQLPGSRVFLESDPVHPLLVGVPDARGAAFADIHEFHSAGSFATAALETLEGFLTSAEGRTSYVFESHPIQSTVRVLLQLDAPETTILEFWSELQDILASGEPQLVYFEESEPRQALTDIIRTRGPAWESYVVDAFNRYPWMKARGLAGIGGILEMIAQYSALMDRLVGSWRFPLLRLAARPQNYPERTDALIEWLASKGSSPKSCYRDRREDRHPRRDASASMAGDPIRVAGCHPTQRDITAPARAGPFAGVRCSVAAGEVQITAAWSKNPAAATIRQDSAQSCEPKT